MLQPFLSIQYKSNVLLTPNGIVGGKKTQIYQNVF